MDNLSPLILSIVGVAVCLPTALLLPFIMHTLKVLQTLERRLDTLEVNNQCPYKQYMTR